MGDFEMLCWCVDERRTSKLVVVQSIFNLNRRIIAFGI
jgi:hypothetical protein